MAVIDARKNEPSGFLTVGRNMHWNMRGTNYLEKRGCTVPLVKFYLRLDFLEICAVKLNSFLCLSFSLWHIIAV